MSCLHHWVNRCWYRKHLTWLTAMLVPFSYLFGLIVALRKMLYQCGVLKSTKLTCPVIVVGNITVGGTGKTPIVFALVNFLRQQGFIPGVVSRGYKGKHQGAVLLNEHSQATEVGDEPLWLYQALSCPVAVGKNRVEAAKLLIQTGCNVVVSDDGLQHYALARNIEIALVDGLRLVGNGYLLPAGPLREPVQRLKSVDYILANQITEQQLDALMVQLNDHGVMQKISAVPILPLQWRRLSDDAVFPLSYFAQETVHAVAGIGNPERFYQTLKELSVSYIPHSFSDHYAFQEKDISFKDERKIVMTEKDGIKCMSFCHQNIYVLEVRAILPETLQRVMLQQLVETRLS